MVDKLGKGPGYDVFAQAWYALLMKFENTLSHKNFPGLRNVEDMGMVLSDNTDGGKLRGLIRRMRHINMIPGIDGAPARNLKLN